MTGSGRDPRIPASTRLAKEARRVDGHPQGQAAQTREPRSPSAEPTLRRPVPHSESRAVARVLPLAHMAGVLGPLGALEPHDFRVMVSAIRTVEEALGDGVKRPRECEAEVRRQWYGS